jgi:hypothetical protein
MIPVCQKKNCYVTEGLTFKRTRYNKNGTEVKMYICRFHNAEDKRIERKRNPGAAYRAIKKYRDKDRKKHNIRHYAQKRIPLKPCEVCGNPKAVRHHDDYSKPLEVRFLCHLHHRQQHPVGTY